MTEPFDQLLLRRLSRREVLLAATAVAPGAWLGRALATDADAGARRAPPRRLGFSPIAGSTADAIVVPEGYSAQVLMRWGDPLFEGAPALDTRGLASGALLRAGSAAAQARQFGYNCDGLVFFPLDRSGRRGLLCVNHEYTDDELMFPDRLGLGREGDARLAEWSRRHPEAARVELAAHGISVLEIERVRDAWRPRLASRWNRRLTGISPIEIAGPARGHALLRTRDDPAGTRVLGTIANCSSGRTPWGTYLTAEENVDDYFGGYRSWRDGRAADARTLAAHARFPLLEGSYHGWEYTEPRFDLRAEPHEPLRFGWIVEIDPQRPGAPARKRTALGRFSHESAKCAVASDGRVAVYMGDDDEFEYVYKFVTRDPWNPRDRLANDGLLDHGVLHVARFDADGTGRWLPLVHGEGPLTPKNGFADAGELAVRARAAADLLGATPMDRPEDIEVSPVTGRVYVSLTKNAHRTPESKRAVAHGRVVDEGVDGANPRPHNGYGHVLEITEAGDDAGSTSFRWDVFLLAGDPADAQGRRLVNAADLIPGRLGPRDTYFGGYDGQDLPAPIGCPDNLGFDPDGNLWIVTDGHQPRGSHNGAFAVPVDGPERGLVRQFLSGPNGAEIAGCEFTPDGETLFLSIQHPGEGGSVHEPASHWPDGHGLPPRPSVIAVRRNGGGRVGR